VLIYHFPTFLRPIPSNPREIHHFLLHFSVFVLFVTQIQIWSRKLYFRNFRPPSSPGTSARQNFPKILGHHLPPNAPPLFSLATTLPPLATIKNSP
jgi:hypothetical protein